MGSISTFIARDTMKSVSIVTQKLQSLYKLFPALSGEKSYD